MFTNIILDAILIEKAGGNVGEIRDNVRRNLGYYLSTKGLSQKELAEKLSVSQSAVTNWIKGNNSPDIEMVAQICDILDITVVDLFGTNSNDKYTNEEKEVIIQYRQRIDMRPAIRILLGISK